MDCIRSPKRGIMDSDYSMVFGILLRNLVKDVGSDLPIQIEDGVTLKVLELFSGTGSVGKIVEKIGNCQVISVDVNAETAGYNPTIVCDVLLFDFKNLGFIPDIIWASPPCQTYSGMAGGKHRTKEDMNPKTEVGRLGKKILERTVEIISYFEDLNPDLLFYMENPHQGLMKYEQSVLSNLPMHKMAVVSYCKYGFRYRKNTDVWTNDRIWIKIAKRCTKDTPCEHVKDGRHPEGVKKHSYMESSPGSLEERYRIPEDLIKEIFAPHLTEEQQDDLDDAWQEEKVERLSQEVEDYDGLADDWDATRPHINPPFSEPSLSAQFQRMAMTTAADARVFPSGRADLSWLSDDSDVEVSSGDEVD